VKPKRFSAFAVPLELMKGMVPFRVKAFWCNHFTLLLTKPSERGSIASSKDLDKARK
jgi:hypothetical protein